MHELAALAGIDGAGLAATIAAFNSAATGDPARFDAGRCDGLAASLEPPKSNWARPIEKPPFLAYPLIGAVAYTFGGLATDARSRVLGRDGPLPGLFAAGEITGHFWGTAPNAVSVLRALVFGRTAGREAISYLEWPKPTVDRALRPPAWPRSNIRRISLPRAIRRADSGVDCAVCRGGGRCSRGLTQPGGFAL